MLPTVMKPCRIPFYQTLATRLKTVDAIRQKSTTFAARDGGGQTGTQGRGGMTRKNRKMQQVKNQGLDFIAIDFETATGKRASVCEVGICAVRNGEIIETSGISEIKQESERNYNIFEINNTEKIKELLPNAIILNVNKFKIDAEKEEIAKIIELLVKNNISIYEVKKEEKSLEDAFFEKTGGNIIE